VGRKFAIVGFGSAGVRALEVLRELRPDSEFLVVSRRVEARADAYTTDSLDSVVSFGPNALVLAGPSSTRVEVMRTLGGLDLPIFIEKPLAPSLEEALSLSELLGSSLDKCQLGYNLRFSESLVAFRDLVRGGRFGRVLRFRAETAQYLPDWRPGTDYRETVSAQARLGGGVLLELSHELDYLRWIFGEWNWVSAWTGRTSALELDVEDVALVTIGIEGNHPESQLVGQLSLDFVRRDKTRTVTAVCEGGTLRWDGISDVVEVYDPSRSTWSTVMTDSSSHSSYQVQWASFLSVVEQQTAPAVSVSDGLAALRAVEAIRQSHELAGPRVFLSSVGHGL
jgi:predicted dehydrogenase